MYVSITYIYVPFTERPKVSPLTGLGTTQDDPICIDSNDAEVVISSSNLGIYISMQCLILLITHDSGVKEVTIMGGTKYVICIEKIIILRSNCESYGGGSPPAPVAQLPPHVIKIIM